MGASIQGPSWAVGVRGEEWWELKDSLGSEDTPTLGWTPLSLPADL